MANLDHLAKLHEGPDVWNAWRKSEPLVRPDLWRANLSGMDLRGTDFRGVDLCGADLRWTNLQFVNFREAILWEANLSEVDLSEANLVRTFLPRANLLGADLHGAELQGAELHEANLQAANLRGANLRRANLSRANLTGAKLHGASLLFASLVEADIRDADLTGCRVFGISAWRMQSSENTKQQNLIITANGESEITVDNIEVAQFADLLLHNAKIRDVIDTIGKKGVLLLGRFTNGRLSILERLREELRKRDLLPMVFNFDKPKTKDFTETVRLLAGLSHFVIADITNPRSAPLELQATVPECMIPFVPILEKGEEPFSMFRDLWIKHRAWVLDPIRYPSVDRLIEVLDAEIIEPAKTRFVELLAKKAEAMRVRDI
jgi:uncharacterized protein YjbI with pentapeptide repeats